jgi:thymidylate synthase (FAD)
MGSDLSIVRAARVSYAAAWRAGEDEHADEKLIHYLYKHQHFTPFEAVTFTFEVKAPIFVVRQWHRHRTQSYNELSGRYRALSEEFYLPSPMVVGMQSATNKQGRNTQSPGEWAEQRAKELEYINTHCEAAFGLYRQLLSTGWPRELARMVLPVNTYTHMFTTLNLRNLFHFLGLRVDPHAQYEIQQYAFAMLDLIHPIVPVAVSAWEESQTGNPPEEF